MKSPDAVWVSVVRKTLNSLRIQSQIKFQLLLRPFSVNLLGTLPIVPGTDLEYEES